MMVCNDEYIDYLFARAWHGNQGELVMVNKNVSIW